MTSQRKTFRTPLTMTACLPLASLPLDACRLAWCAATSADCLDAEGLQARAFSASGLIAWAWDRATDCVTLSPDLEARWGIASGEVGGTLAAVLGAVHPDDRAAFGEAIRRSLETDDDHYSLFRIVRLDGAVRWTEAKGRAVRGAAGEVCGLTGIAQDVTDRVEAGEKARAREDHLQALADNVPVLIARMDTQCRYVFANRAYEDLLGVPIASVLGRTMVEVLGVAAYETIRPYVDKALAGESVEYDAAIPYPTGVRHMHGAYTPERGPYGAVTGYLASVMDITARREAEEATRRLALIVENSRDAIISTDLDCMILSWNQGAERLYGWTAAEAIGRSLKFTLPPEQPLKEVRALLAGLEDADGVCEYEAVRVCKDGTRRHVAVTFSPVRDVAGAQTGHALIVRDISAQKEAERERARLLARTEALLAEATERADRDSLTGLLNHRAFHKKLEEEGERALREGGSLAVAMLDLDHFKSFNDAYGHPVGDDALRRVADALRLNCRPYDTPARYGGDEFAVLMPGVGPDEAGAVAARLARGLEGITVRPPGAVDGDAGDVPLRMSVGLAVFPAEARSPAEAVALADKRLYAAKSGGGASDAALAGEEAERLRADLRADVEGFAILDALVAAVGAKDRYTSRHSEDVMAHALGTARVLGLGDADRRTLAAAALLHDLGNIGTPDAVLRKPGQLSAAETEIVRRHPLMGAIILGAVPGLEEWAPGILAAVRSHHERWDGAGYPDGLAGETISLPARILAVADAFSALTSDRPYRQRMDEARALRTLEEGAGTQWDPACVQAFLESRPG